MKLQTVHHSDGSREILRKLSLDWLERCEDGNPLLYESSIVWLEDISKLPYVRVMEVARCKSRRGPMRQSNGGRIVGYSTLHANAPPDPAMGTFTRRVFYLKESDYNASRVGLHRLPADAIDPNTVYPGVPGASLNKPAPPAIVPPAMPGLEPAAPSVAPKRRRGDSVVLDWLGVPEDAPPPLPPPGRWNRFG